MIWVDPEWGWVATYNINREAGKLLRERYGVGLQSVTVVGVDRPYWRVPVVRDFVYVPIQYVDGKGVTAWLWRLFGKVFKKPRWGRDRVMLEPACSHEVKEIQLSQYIAEDPWGVKYRWWMGYGPRSKVLAIGGWEGSTGVRFAQSAEGE